MVHHAAVDGGGVVNHAVHGLSWPYLQKTLQTSSRRVWYSSTVTPPGARVAADRSPTSALRHTRINFVAAAVGVLLTLSALANSVVTIATRHPSGYRTPLLTALVSELLALVCLAIPLVRGPLAWRVAALVLACPALFVLSDFAQRAPYAFGGG